MQPLAGLGGAEFGGPVVPLARGDRVGLQANDFELGQLVGILARCQRHGALRQSEVGGALEKLARRIDIAALEQFQPLAVESQRAFAVAWVGRSGRAGLASAAEPT